MSRDSIFEIVENIKEKLTSEEYKTLLEEISKIRKDEDYIISIMYVDYIPNQDVNGTSVKSSVHEYKLKVNLNDFDQEEEVSRFNYMIVYCKEYNDMDTNHVILCLPKIYHSQLMTILHSQFIWIGDDDDCDCSECHSKTVAYKTESVLVKVTKNVVPNPRRVTINEEVGEGDDSSVYTPNSSDDEVIDE